MRSFGQDKGGFPQVCGFRFSEVEKLQEVKNGSHPNPVAQKELTAQASYSIVRKKGERSPRPGQGIPISVKG